MIASAMEQTAGPGNLVARLAGDEFAIALATPRAKVANAWILAEDLLAAVTRPMEVDDKLVQIGAFLGHRSRGTGRGPDP